MNQLLNRKLTKTILDIMIFCEFSNEDIIDPDVSINLMEQIAAELLDLDSESKNNLINNIKELSETYEGEKKEFVQKFCENFGLLDIHNNRLQ